MALSLIDSHAHLDMPHFDRDLPEVIARAKEVGVSHIVTVGIDLNSSRRALELAEKHPEVVAAVEIHPQDAASANASDIDILADLACHPRVVALGEMGLDYYRLSSPKAVQLQVFNWQLALAEKSQLPVIIHCRDAQSEMLSLLEEWTRRYSPPSGRSHGVIHCFSGDMETARRYLKMGFFVSFGGYIGYPSSRNLGDTIRSIPENRLLIETDCPFLPPQKHRGQRNEPAYIAITAATLAEIRGGAAADMAVRTAQNAQRLFRWPAESAAGDYH